MVNITFLEEKGINFAFNSETYDGGDTLIVTLNSFQALQIKDSNDLTGSMIKSDKPVAVFSGNRGINLNVDAFNPRGHIVEQTPPVEMWGSEFYVVPFPDRNNTLVKFVAAYANTTVTVETNSGSQTWESEFDGDYRDTIVYRGSEYVKITADKPILVAQFAESGTNQPNQRAGAPAMMLVPAVEQWRSDYYVYHAGTTTMDIMLVAGVGRQNGIRVDGGQQRNGWTNFPGGAYRGKVVTVGPGVHTIQHTNDQVNIG